MRKILAFSSLVLLLVGCGVKEPVKLDNNSAITINQGLIVERVNNIPKDPFLEYSNWSYNMYFSKLSNGMLVKDEDIVKTFYLAHNADRIIILGYEPTAFEYRNYFIKNGVTAPIEISKLDMIGNSKTTVNVLFFHEKKDNSKYEKIKF